MKTIKLGEPAQLPHKVLQGVALGKFVQPSISVRSVQGMQSRSSCTAILAISELKLWTVGVGMFVRQGEDRRSSIKQDATTLDTAFLAWQPFFTIAERLAHRTLLLLAESSLASLIKSRQTPRLALRNRSISVACRTQASITSYELFLLRRDIYNNRSATTLYLHVCLVLSGYDIFTKFTLKKNTFESHICDKEYKLKLFDKK